MPGQQLTREQRQSWDDMNRYAREQGLQEVSEEDLQFYNLHVETIMSADDLQRYNAIVDHIKELFLTDQAAAEQLQEAFADAEYDARIELEDLKVASLRTGANKRKYDFFGRQKRAAIRKINALSPKAEAIAHRRKSDEQKRKFEAFNLMAGPEGAVVQAEHEHAESFYERERKALTDSFYATVKDRKGKPYPTNGPWRDLARFTKRIGKANEADPNVMAAYAEPMYVMQKGRHSDQAPGEKATIDQSYQAFHFLSANIRFTYDELQTYVNDHPLFFGADVDPFVILQNYGELQELFKKLQITNDLCGKMAASRYYQERLRTDPSLAADKAQMDTQFIYIRAVANTVLNLTDFVASRSRANLRDNPGNQDYVIPWSFTFGAQMGQQMELKDRNWGIS